MSTDEASMKKPNSVATEWGEACYSWNLDLNIFFEMWEQEFSEPDEENYAVPSFRKSTKTERP